MRGPRSGSRVDDDSAADLSRRSPDHTDRVRGARIGVADPEVIVHREISIGPIRRWARSWGATRPPIEELEHGMRRVPESTGLHGDSLDEDAAVPEQRRSVARETFVRVHVRDACDPELRRVLLGGSAHMGYVKREAHGAIPPTRDAGRLEGSPPDKGGRQEEGHRDENHDQDETSPPPTHIAS